MDNIFSENNFSINIYSCVYVITKSRIRCRSITIGIALVIFMSIALFEAINIVELYSPGS